jgi:hypothetical protein
LQKGCTESVAEAARELVEPGLGIGRAPADAKVEAVEAFDAKPKGDDCEEKEGDLVREWKHGIGQSFESIRQEVYPRG